MSLAKPQTLPSFRENPQLCQSVAQSSEWGVTQLPDIDVLREKRFARSKDHTSLDKHQSAMLINRYGSLFSLLWK